MKHVLALIHWFGPFELDKVIGSEWGAKKGLYLITGKQKRERVANIQYCGKTEYQTYAKRLGRHHRAHFITREREIWLGLLPYVSEEKFTYYLDKSEKLLTYYLKPIINEKNTKTIPSPTTLINYWFKPFGGVREKRISIAQQAVDDVISWDGKVFRSGKLSIHYDDYE